MHAFLTSAHSEGLGMDLSDFHRTKAHHAQKGADAAPESLRRELLEIVALFRQLSLLAREQDNHPPRAAEKPGSKKFD